jgi:hypothetical protein
LSSCDSGPEIEQQLRAAIGRALAFALATGSAIGNAVVWLGTVYVLAMSGNGLRSTLEHACAEARCSASVLTVLATQNDPFRVDTPARHRDGQWLAMHAERLGLGHRKIHLRGLHYMLVSTSGLTKPDGSPYRNVEEDWAWLVMHAAKAARWLGYLRFDQIIDARNAEPVINIRESKSELPPQPWISVGLDISVPEAVDLEPYVYVDPFQVDQPYRLVFFGEKTSLEEILAPIARECRADLYLPSGEISDTLLYQMAQAGAEDGRPMVVLCFSDCDPSGWQMPISIGRKLQAFKALLFPELEFQVRRVALIPDQVRVHGLPSTPLKATERRADRWQAAMGVAQTEIDALAALQPTLLRRMAREAIRPFYDPTLLSRCNAAQSEWRDACQEAVDEQTDQDHLDAIAEQTNEALAAVRGQIRQLEEQIRIDPHDYALPGRPALPKPESAVEPDGLPLIDSAWSWAEQSRRLIASKAYDGEAA